MNTKIEYLYRDASNYKFWYEEVISGEISEQQIKTILCSLDDGEYFIPSDVGFHCDYADGYPPNDDDHPWCELGEWSFQLTQCQPTLPRVTPENLVAAFQIAAWKSWPSAFNEIPD